MIIFLVAPPRSGTSFLYNLLCYNLDLIYPTNFLKFFKNNYYIGFLFQNLFFTFFKKKKKLKSRYGFTKGFFSPSEFGFFFRYYLKTNNDELYKKIKKKNICRLINKINKIRKGKNILFKNFFTIKDIKYISQNFSDCKWIFIKRPKKEIIESFYKMRKKLRTNQRPIVYIRNYSDTKINVKKNIDEINGIIDQSINKIPNKNYIIIKFDQLTKYPFKQISKIKKKFNI